ncbi:APC family permease [Oceanobacillus jeddahense]|uniref:APC family permease n=1 Tax=Oceanobacillus jeddahense TaxID=1462527 RepID=A0ABY5JTJ4_9BACI|nr:APC family permease [Oceanobacillus jeddahense]UUI03524.1 APC family permease [Oceanobacillus jeddahense]
MKDGMSGKDFFALAFGSMIGIGWVISIPAWMAAAGSIGAIIAILVTMLVIIPIGFVYGELTSSLKISGGEYAYTYLAVGKLSAFVCGWFLVLGYLIILPWVAVSVAALTSYLFPSMDAIPLYSLFGSVIYLPHLIVSLIMVTTMVYLNYKGVKQSSKFQNIATWMMIATFFVFIIGGFIAGSNENITQTTSESGLLGGVATAIASILFFMNGFDTIPKARNEAGSNMNKANLGKAIVGTIIAGSLLYSVIVLASSFIMPADELVNLGELPLVSAFEAATGSKFLTVIIVFGVLLGVITTFNGFLFAGSRLVQSFSEAGFLPKVLSKEDQDNKTPKNALIFMFIITVFGIFLGQGILAPFIVMGGISFLIAWFFMSLSSVQLYKKKPNMHRPYSPPGGIITSYIATFFSGILTLLMVIPGTPISLHGIEYILFVIWLIIGIAIYASYSRNRIDFKGEVE